MNEIFRGLAVDAEITNGAPVNISRRGFLLASAGALVIGFGIPIRSARAQEAATKVVPGTRVPAFLEIRPNNTARLMSPFVEGGQGIFTGMAQIVGEELDLDPSPFTVENAPAGPDYQVILNGLRLTGGSMSTRLSYDTMRHLGASARLLILQASATRLGVSVGELTTEPGRVIHATSGRSLSYGDVAADALDLPIPSVDQVKLKDSSQFRWIGKPVQRLDIHDKSTGRAIYAIDCKVDGMLHAAVQHAPRLGMAVGIIRNEDAVKAMKGVQSVHRLAGAVAVVAERWWAAKRAVEALQVDWQEANGTSAVEGGRIMPIDFSTTAAWKSCGRCSEKDSMSIITKATRTRPMTSGITSSKSRTCT